MKARIYASIAALMFGVIYATTAQAQTMPVDCYEEPAVCQELLSLHDADREARGLPPITLEDPESTSAEVSATTPPPAGDWTFVEYYKLQMMEAAEFMCLDSRVQKNFRTLQWWSLLEEPDAFDTYPDLNAERYYELKEEFQQRLNAEIAANGGVAPEGKRTDVFSVEEIVKLLDENGFPYCSIGYYDPAKHGK